MIDNKAVTPLYPWHFQMDHQLIEIEVLYKAGFFSHFVDLFIKMFDIFVEMSVPFTADYETEN